MKMAHLGEVSPFRSGGGGGGGGGRGGVKLYVIRFVILGLGHNKVSAYKRVEGVL